MKKTLKILFPVLTLFWMILIFYMSAANAEKSTDMSMSVGYTVGMITVDGFAELPAPEQQSFAEQIDHPVRKTAHFLEYTMLGLLLSIDLLLFFRLTPFKRFLLSLGLGILYAATDEMHQLFVSGRSGQFTDILIDGSGVLLGSLLVLIVAAFFQSKKSPTSK